jgi:hypothetical protein
LHFYLNNDDSVLNTYNELVEELKVIKAVAQEKKNNNNSDRFEAYLLGNDEFEIMATAISGFSVVLRNRDVSIALKSSKTFQVHTPIIKVEFRSQFLARYGYVKAVKQVQSIISQYVLHDYKIKVSEIHLATDIQGHHFNFLDFWRMKSRARSQELFEDDTSDSRSSMYGQSKVFSGMWYGSGNYRFRLYNKTIESNKFKDKSFVKPLLWEKSLDYDKDQTVWRIEVQFRREKLKQLSNLQNGVLDGFESVLNSIPSLWNKAMNDFKIMSLSDGQVFDILRGYKQLKNGNRRILTKKAIYHMFQRSEPLVVWQNLQEWNGREHTKIQTYINPPMSSQTFVQNSWLSVLSTTAKHYGAMTTTTLIQGLREANRINIEEKGVSLVENSMLKQLDYFDKVERLTDRYGLVLPSTKDLELNIINEVMNVSSVLFDGVYSSKIYEKLDTRMMVNENPQYLINRHLSAKCDSAREREELFGVCHA